MITHMSTNSHETLRDSVSKGIVKFLEDFQRDGETREPCRRAMYDAEPNQYLRRAAVQTLLQRGLGTPSKEQREADN